MDVVIPQIVGFVVLVTLAGGGALTMVVGLVFESPRITLSGSVAALISTPLLTIMSVVAGSPAGAASCIIVGVAALVALSATIAYSNGYKAGYKDSTQQHTITPT